jgi:hypothetical protein
MNITFLKLMPIILVKKKTPRLGDRKHNSLDENNITSQNIGNPILSQLQKNLMKLCTKKDYNV